MHSAKGREGYPAPCLLGQPKSPLLLPALGSEHFHAPFAERSAEVQEGYRFVVAGPCPLEWSGRAAAHGGSGLPGGGGRGNWRSGPRGCLKLSGRAWCPQELGVGGRGGRGRSAQGRGQRADLGCEDPRAPRCHSLVPPEDRRTFSIIYVSTGQSQFPALHAGDFSQTLSQPEPSLWPAWRAATSFRSHSLGMAASGPKTGSPEGSSQP